MAKRAARKSMKQAKKQVLYNKAVAAPWNDISGNLTPTVLDAELFKIPAIDENKSTTKKMQLRAQLMADLLSPEDQKNLKNAFENEFESSSVQPPSPSGAASSPPPPISTSPPPGTAPPPLPPGVETTTSSNDGIDDEWDDDEKEDETTVAVVSNNSEETQRFKDDQSLIASLRFKIIQLEKDKVILEQKLNDKTTSKKYTEGNTTCTSSAILSKFQTTAQTTTSSTSITTTTKLKTITPPHIATLHLLSSIIPLNINQTASKILSFTFENSNDMTQMFNVLVENAIDGASYINTSTRGCSEKVQSITQLLGVLGSPPSSLSLQRRFLKVAELRGSSSGNTKGTYFWKDGTNGMKNGPFTSCSNALHNACLQLDPAEKILYCLLNEIQRNMNETYMTSRCLGTMRILSLLHIEGITPSEVMIQMIKRLIVEAQEYNEEIVAILSEIVNVLLRTSPHVVTDELGRQIENVLLQK